MRQGQAVLTVNGDSSDRNETGTDRALTVNRDSSDRNETGTER